jgi:hypothetical protein
MLIFIVVISYSLYLSESSYADARSRNAAFLCRGKGIFYVIYTARIDADAMYARVPCKIVHAFELVMLLFCLCV